MQTQAPMRLQATGICKSFPGVRALADANLSLRAGEVHALMGENGAGKSTLIKIITGVYSPDSGTIDLDGSPVSFNNVRDAERAGVSCVFQEVNLVRTLSVAENLTIGRFPKRAGLIGWRRARQFARDALSRLGLDIDVSLPLRSYSIAIQQMVAIARAVTPVRGYTPPRVLILDEPTSSLDASEVDRLFAVMAQLRDAGMAVLLVTHFLDQVYRISDRVTVLRNGNFIGEWLARDLPRMKLVEAMVGKELNESWLSHDASRAPDESHPPRLKMSGIGKRGMLEPIDLVIGQGEKVGLIGLLGSGRTETARLIFGDVRADSGTLSLENKQGPFHSPRRAIAAGLGMTPEDRKADGILPNLSVQDNIAIAVQARRGILRRLSNRHQADLTARYIRQLNIKTPSPDQPIRLLSGGNQQKVLLARWLATEPLLLLLDEPTRGVDVHAKREITRLVDELCTAGMSVLFITSELEEAVAVCDRVVVLRDRRKIGELRGAELNVGRIIQLIASSEEAPA